MTTDLPDYGDARAAVLRERAIFDAMPAKTEQLGNRPGMMVQALENRFHWIDRPEAGQATAALARDIADVMTNGIPQVVGTYGGGGHLRPGEPARVSEGRVMQDLIAKLEKATGPARELDAAIECELRRLQAYEAGLNDKQRSHWKPIDTKGEVIDDQGYTRYHAPTYSFSIDAALTLVPDGYLGELDIGRDPDPGAPKGVARLWAPRGDGDVVAVAGSPAIALCIAALRARAAATKATT